MATHDRAAGAGPGRVAGPGPDAWRPFGPVDEHLRVGPGLAVARGDGRRGPGAWDVLPPEEGRRLLLEHGFRMDPALRRAAEAAPRGATVQGALAVLATTLPGFRVLEQTAFGAVLARVPEAVVLLDAPRGELESVGWHSGQEALGLVAAHLEVLDVADPDPDVVEVPLDPPDAPRLLRGVLWGLLVLLGGPALAAPLLFLGDPFWWFYGIGAMWLAGILAAGRVLTWWEERRPRRWVRLDPWRLWLPDGLASGLIARADLEVRTTWHPDWGASTTGSTYRAPVPRNPATTHVHLRAPDLELTLTAADLPPEPRPPRLEREQLGVGGTWVGVPWQDLRRLRSALEEPPRG